MACHGRPRLETTKEATKGDSAAHVVQYDLTAGLEEASESQSLLGGKTAMTLSSLVVAVQKAVDDDVVEGFLLSLGSGRLNWAQAEQLGELFADVRGGGKPVHCHAHSYNNAGLWFAARACDRLHLSPAGDVDSVSIAAQVVYLKRLLERFQVHADFLHVGKYKSAAEVFTREGPSDEAREALLEVLGSMRSTWLASIAKARANQAIATLVEDGPWGADRALELGLVDALGYLSDARDAIEEVTGVEHVKRGLGGRDDNRARQIAHLIQAIAGASKDDTRDPRIVVLPAAGSITMKPSGPLYSGGIAAEPLTRTIRRLKKDEAVKAVVLRIDSPGGSALASDLLWHELTRLKEKKPLVVSVGDLAASGGYFMACAGDTIVASRTSIVGSIGVVGGKVAVGQAFSEQGVDAVTMSPATTDTLRARAAYMSALTPWDDATKQRISDQMRGIYELFLERVSAGRNLPLPEVRKIAEGRIWSGEQGLGLKLVDEIGGLTRAIAIARERAKLPDDARVDVEGGADSLLEMLLLDDDADEDDVARALARYAASRADFLPHLPEGTLRHVGSLQPLLDGEPAVAALPFAISMPM